MSTSDQNNTSYSINSQVIYNFAANVQPVKIKQDGEDDKHVVGHDDFLRAMGSSEEALGQKILQDNNEKIRQAVLVADQGLVQLDTGTATTADIAAQVNSIITVLTNLVIQGKNT